MKTLSSLLKNTTQQGDCMIWTRSKDPSGYGKLSINGKTAYAHRLVWQLSTGVLPGKKVVCHKCDNPSCINPAHLFLGTQDDNIQDMVSKGRSKHKEKKVTGYKLIVVYIPKGMQQIIEIVSILAKCKSIPKSDIWRMALREYAEREAKSMMLEEVSNLLAEIEE